MATRRYLLTSAAPRRRESSHISRTGHTGNWRNVNMAGHRGRRRALTSHGQLVISWEPKLVIPHPHAKARKDLASLIMLVSWEIWK